jgi:acyl-CoA thioester hydrolase
MTTAPDLSPASALLYTAAISVRWRDLDAFNHVNNSTYLTYLEEARVQWLQRLPGSWSDEHAMPVMAASTLNYRLPIEWPGNVHIELYCARLGNSSMTVAHRIVDPTDRNKLYCDGHVVMVWMDPASGKSVSLPQAIRDAASA